MIKARQIRNDRGGAGHYGASRTKKGKKYKHKGTDYCCTPGEEILSPATGLILREARPYDHGEYTGFVLDTKRCRLMVFYVKLHDGLIGAIVRQGQPIGIAQDISLKYRDVLPHFHIEVVRCDPEILLRCR